MHGLKRTMSVPGSSAYQCSSQAEAREFQPLCLELLIQSRNYSTVLVTLALCSPANASLQLWNSVCTAVAKLQLPEQDLANPLFGLVQLERTPGLCMYPSTLLGLC